MASGKLTDAQRAEIRRRWASVPRPTQASLAREFGVTRAAIHQLVTYQPRLRTPREPRAEPKTRPPKLTTEIRQQAIEALEAGELLGQVARQLGLSVQQVSRIRRAAGIPAMTRSEAAAIGRASIADKMANDPAWKADWLGRLPRKGYAVSADLDVAAVQRLLDRLKERVAVARAEGLEEIPIDDLLAELPTDLLAALRRHRLQP